jgi:hypothetical protein
MGSSVTERQHWCYPRLRVTRKNWVKGEDADAARGVYRLLLVHILAEHHPPGQPVTVVHGSQSWSRSVITLTGETAPV